MTLEKRYQKITRRFASDNQLKLLAKLIKFFAYVHSQIKIELRLETCWGLGTEGNVESLWYSMNNFIWRSGEEGLQNFLYQGFKNHFLPNLEDANPRNDSGMTFFGVERVSVTLHKLPSLRFGCNKVSLPLYIDKKTVISPRSKGNTCFLNSLIAAAILRDGKRTYMTQTFHRQLENLHLFKNKKIVKNAKKILCLKDIHSPSTFSDFKTFSENNTEVGLVVFESQDGAHLNTIFVSENFSEKIWKIRLFSFVSKKTRIAHLCLIHNFSNFMNSLSTLNGKKVPRQLFCRYCEIRQTSKIQILEDHEKVCERNPFRELPESELIFPEFEESIKVMNSSVKSPPLLIGFCDFETSCHEFPDPERCEKCKNKLLECNCSFQLNKGVFRSLSYSLIIIDGKTHKTVFEKYFVKNTSHSQDAGENLIETLSTLKYKFFEILAKNFKYDLSNFNLEKYRKTKNCKLCKRKFNTSDMTCRKTIHHNHFKQYNNVISIICTRCNLNSNQFRRECLPIFFYNGTKFDNKLILEPILKIWGPDNVESLDKNAENINLIRFFPYIIKDTMSFITGSLEKNVELLKESTDINNSLSILKNHNICKTYNYKGELKICDHFPDQSEQCKKCHFNSEIFKLLCGKLAYPYDLISCPESLNITKFPQLSQFYSNLKQEHISDDQYLNAMHLYNFCKDFRTFHSVYNILDTILTASVMIQFNELISSTLDGIQFTHYVSLAHLSFDACLRRNLISDEDDRSTVIRQIPKEHEDLYLFAEKSVRGGGNFFNIRFEIASEFKKVLFKFMSTSEKNELNQLGENIESVPKSKLYYFDAINLYGHSLTQALPVNKYKQISSRKIKKLNRTLNKFDNLFPEYNSEDSKHKGGFFLINVPKLKKKYKDFPLLSDHYTPTLSDASPLQLNLYRKFYSKKYSNCKINKKLIFSMKRKKSYFAHHKIISFLISEGVKIKLVRGWTFNEKPIFSEYINNLASLRKKSTSNLHKTLFKLLSNIIYGKTLQSGRNRVNFSYIYSDGDPEYNALRISGRNFRSKCHFKSSKFLTEDIIQVKSVPQTVGTNHPILIGCSVLDNSKLKMLNIFYKNLLPTFGSSQKLLYHDTDSLIMSFKGDDIEQKLSQMHIFDFSSFGEEDPVTSFLSPEQVEENKGVPGFLKDELKDGVLLATIVLQKKQYCNIFLKRGIDGSFYLSDSVTCKGLNVEQLNFKMYLDCILKDASTSQVRNKISSKSGQLHFVKLRRKGINSFDNSNYLHSCGICVSPINNKNSFLCQNIECKIKKIYLQVLSDNFDKIINSKFRYSDGVVTRIT